MLFRSALLSATLLLSTFLGLTTALALPPDASLDPIASHEPRLSNAARLQRGLPPQRPRQLFTPDRAARALSPRASNSATTAYYAEVAYASDPTTVVGYLALTPSVYGVAVQTSISNADNYYAPTTVPATDALLYTYAKAYGYNYYIFMQSGGSSTTAFGGTGSSSSSLAPIWDFSDFDASGHIALTYVAGGSTAYNLYIDPTNGNKLYGGASAAAINTVYSTSISETDEVLVTLVKET